MLMVFVLSACGNQAGESSGNASEDLMPADREISAGERDQADLQSAADGELPAVGLITSQEPAQYHIGLSEQTEDNMVVQEGHAGTVPESGVGAGLPLSILQNCKTTLPAVACGTNEEPGENPKEYSREDTRIEKLGLSLEVTECTAAGATLVFRQSGGSPSGELIFGDAYHIERYDGGEWIDMSVAIAINYGFHEIEYTIPLGEEQEFQIDWEWLYGELEPGEYRIRKDVDDFRKTADYDVYEIYAYFTVDS